MRCRTQVGRERGPPFNRALLYALGLELLDTVIEVVPVIQEKLPPSSQLLAMVMSRVGGRLQHQEGRRQERSQAHVERVWQ
jgi:hypothetical protein